MLAIFEWPLFTDDLERLAAAALLGGVLGFEREISGHFAGLRTHMMVALGAALFTLAGVSVSHSLDEPASVSRVIQGLAAGIGFLGAGTILKLGPEREIKGLTTASSVWLAAALGTAAGLAEYSLSAAALSVSILVLTVLKPIERWVDRHAKHRNRGQSAPPSAD